MPVREIDRIALPDDAMQRSRLVCGAAYVAIEEPTSAMQAIAKAAASPAKAGTKAYFLQRLQREHPALAVKIASGEMTVYAASIAAGLRKAPKATKWAQVKTYMQEANA